MQNKKQSKGDDPILLKDQKIDLKEVQEFKLYHRLMYGEVVIEKLDFTHLKTQTREWRTYKQEFVFDSQINNLITTCTCGKKNVFCEHRYAVLEEIIHRFGDDFFIDDFVKRHTEKRLAQYGLSLDDNYNQIIDFELTTKGLVEIPKVKNLKSVNNFSLLLV